MDFLYVYLYSAYKKNWCKDCTSFISSKYYTNWNDPFFKSNKPFFFTNKVNLGHQSNLNKYLLQFFKIMLYLGCINFLFNRDIWIASEFSSWAFYSYYFLFPLKCKKLSFSTFSTLITKTLVLYLVTYLWAGWMFNQLLFVNKFVSSV